MDAASQDQQGGGGGGVTRRKPSLHQLYAKRLLGAVSAVASITSQSAQLLLATEGTQMGLFEWDGYKLIQRCLLLTQVYVVRLTVIRNKYIVYADAFNGVRFVKFREFRVLGILMRELRALAAENNMLPLTTADVVVFNE